jgi:hypothetical protein
MTQYRVLVGIDYPPNKRAEAGTLVSDIPEKSAKWLIDQGLIEPADGKSKKTITPVVEETFDPAAVDTDGDGFLQDGTPFQRPVEEK